MFKCGFFEPEAGEYDFFEVTISQLKDKWRTLYDELFKERPNTALAIWPMTSGIYSLERII